MDFFAVNACTKNLVRMILCICIICSECITYREGQKDHHTSSHNIQSLFACPFRDNTVQLKNETLSMKQYQNPFLSRGLRTVFVWWEVEAYAYNYAMKSAVEEKSEIEVKHTMEECMEMNCR